MARNESLPVAALHLEIEELRRRVTELEIPPGRRGSRRGGHVGRVARSSARAGALVLAFAALIMTPVLALSQGFADVPPTNSFHADIDAIAAAGVTTGCGDGNYCPEEFVTREQMAAFMNRLGALQTGKAPVVNADRLDGTDSTGFLRYGVTLPAGQMLTGTFAFSDSGEPGSEVTGEDDIAFLAPLPASPVVHLINRGDPVPSGCSGNVRAPDASPGHLCVWVAYSSEGDTLDGYYAATNGFQNTSSTRGIVVFLHDADADGFVEGTGTWAVRASTGLAAPASPAQPAAPGARGSGHATSGG